MPRIPIMSARYRDDLPSVTDIERRLFAHLARLRGWRVGSDPGTPSDGDDDIAVW